MNTRVQTAFLSSVVALAGWVAAVDPAAAAVYRGRFDPVYGTPFNNPPLAWAGSVEINVDDSCVNPGFVSLLSSCGSTGFQITKAEVYLYRAGDALDSEGFPITPRQTMDFGAAAGPAISGLNWGLTFDGNENLVAANSTAFPALPGNIEETRLNESPFNPSSTAQAYFSLQFLGSYAQLYWFERQPTATELLVLTAGIGDIGLCRDNGVRTIPGFGILGYPGNRCGWSDPDNFNSLGSFITFERVVERVPEPATLALVPAALAIMGMVGVRTRRRRSASLPQ